MLTFLFSLKWKPACFDIVRINSVLIILRIERVKNVKKQLIPKLEILQVFTLISGVISHA